MSYQRQPVVVRIRLQLFQLVEHEQNVGFAFFIHPESADIGHADLGHQRRVGRKILLDAGHQISPGREYVGQERILGVLDRVAVADDGDRKLPVAVVCLHLVVAAHGKVHGDRPLPRLVEQIERLVPNAPLADAEIHDAGEGAHAAENRNSSLHRFRPDHFDSIDGVET